MDRTVVALYDNLDDAQQTVRDLLDSGLPHDQISLVASDQTGQFGEKLSTPAEPSGAVHGAGVGAGIGAALGGIGGLLVGLGALAIPGIGPVLAAGPLAAAIGGVAGAGAGAIAGGAAGGLIGGLTEMGVTEQQAGYFAEGVRRGGTLVTTHTDDATTERAKELMNRHHPVDVNERAGEWRQTGWTGFNPSNRPYHPDTPDDPNTVLGSNDIQGLVSDTNIGRAGPAISDIPFTGTAMDEDEMGNTGMGAASIGNISTPTAENTASPTSNIRTGDYTGAIDGGGVITGPSPDVPLGVPMHAFDFYDADFRNHYANTFGDRGYTYNQYMPAYRYGYDLARNDRYRDMNWTSVEPDARRFWDERHPGTWDEFKDAVYHAWMSVTETMM
jgi:hypothetical protein